MGECSCPSGWPRPLPVMLPHGLMVDRLVHVETCDLRPSWKTSENLSTPEVPVTSPVGSPLPCRQCRMVGEHKMSCGLR